MADEDSPSTFDFEEEVEREPDSTDNGRTEQIDITRVEDASTTADTDSGILQPATDNIEEIARVYEKYEQVKTKILNDQDRQSIGGSLFIKKSGWRKIATAFNVSVSIVEREQVKEDGVLTWRVKAAAEAPNGKRAEAFGSCSSNESNFMIRLGDSWEEAKSELRGYKKGDTDSINKDDVMKIDGSWRLLRSPREVSSHDILATASTRAKNRAISDLVGGGEVSAEEIDPTEMI